MSADAPSGRGVLRLALDWFVPSTCAACGIERGETGGAGACPACWDGIETMEDRLGCPVCAVPESAGICRECLQSPPPVTGTSAFGVYGGGLRKLIAAFKFKGFDLLAQPFADRLAHLAGSLGLDQERPLVVGVPSTRARNRQRGFDPGILLARETARRLRLSHVRILRRLHSSSPQSTLPRAARVANVASAFGIRRWPGVPCRPVLLVDDIMTTGATGFAAARALHLAGIPRIHLLVLARTPAPA